MRPKTAQKKKPWITLVVLVALAAEASDIIKTCGIVLTGFLFCALIHINLKHQLWTVNMRSFWGGKNLETLYRRLTRNWPPLIGHFWIYLAFLVKIIFCNTSYVNTLNYPAVHRIWKIGRKNEDSMCKWQLNGWWSLNKPKNPVTCLYYIRM